MAKGLLNYIFENNASEALDIINKSLYRRSGEMLQEKRKQVISKMFEGTDISAQSTMCNVLSPTKNDGLDADNDWASKNALYKRQFQERKRLDFKKALREGRHLLLEPTKHRRLREAAQDARRKLNTKGTDVPGGIASVPQKACGPEPTFASVPGPNYSHTDLSGGHKENESGLDEHIVKTGSGYELKSKKTGKNLGTATSKAGILKREREVEYFKHHKG